MSMFLLVLSRVLSAWFAFFLPSYCTFKALSHRSLTEPGLEKWAVYWCVVGAFMTVEYAGEWLVRWFPFYWELKTLFLLYLSLPQTEGATYIFFNFVKPFYEKNEADIDAGIEHAKTNSVAFLQTRLAMLWDMIYNLINKTAATTRKHAPQVQNKLQSMPGKGVNPVETAKSLWGAYAPAFLGKKPTPPSPATAPSQNGQNGNQDTSPKPSSGPESAPATYEVEPELSHAVPSAEGGAGREVDPAVAGIGIAT
ncbi:hypothetical protein JAAARDRAFT_65434 [Jaapia argillacea MUCL 33604]|uniref:Protein YOP1 n=1 Tax=Jaapia argillacea MUCL 33604 TaxID=933084 RepID=A0A067QL84_9AGAM|nr:hypothetical protein JAAARDRAFT_65434 [Jaapia argillacea MUCL 33604]